MKKIIKRVLFILITIILLFPVTYQYKDGGTVEYKAILYSIKDVHCINPDYETGTDYIEGYIIKILGFKIFDNVEW